MSFSFEIQVWRIGLSEASAASMIRFACSSLPDTASTSPPKASSFKKQLGFSQKPESEPVNYSFATCFQKRFFVGGGKEILFSDKNLEYVVQILSSEIYSLSVLGRE